MVSSPSLPATNQIASSAPAAKPASHASTHADASEGESVAGFLQPTAVSSATPATSAIPTRGEIQLDAATHRVVWQEIDRASGAVVQQTPTEDQLRLFARTRDEVERLLAVDV